MLFGLTAALTKATTDRFDDGFVAVVANWHLYALIGVSVVAFSLSQSALQTGALAPAIATTMSFDTIAGVALGMTILDEELHDSTLARSDASRLSRSRSSGSSCSQAHRALSRHPALRRRGRPETSPRKASRPNEA